MPAAAVVGLQWGDEGKGKIVDYCASKADIIVRFSGGANAGHTVIVGGKTHKFRLMPSGVLAGKRVMMAAGMVIDPEVLLEEIELAKKETPKLRLLVSGKAHVVTPYHKLLDGASDKQKGAFAAGTTKRGIGPTYADKADRIGLRICDITGSEEYLPRARFLRDLKQKLARNVYGIELEGTEDFVEKYAELGKRIAPYVGDTAMELNIALSESRRVLFEGAQGALLDIDHGVYPYTTSSNSTSGGACSSSGVAPQYVKHVLGVVKAYTSRVGDGPLVTELDNELAEHIREKGKEYGTVTGRPRRIGWLDLVAVRYACMINGADLLAVTKLDTLGGLGKVHVCKGYELNGKKIAVHPIRASDIAKCTPVYETFAGWPDHGPAGWRKIVREGYKALHPNCRKFLEYVARSCNAKIMIVSVGPGREDTILMPKTSLF
jgi:adenylosuccinate synthase